MPESKETLPEDPSRILQRASEIIEADRASLGNEIHDALLPLLFACSAGVARLKVDQAEAPAEIGNRIDQITSWLDQAMQVGRKMLTANYPPELISTVWTRAVIDTAERLYGDANVNVDWLLDDGLNDVSMPTAISAYRIVIEAIRNAIRHGDPANISIVGESDGGHCRITVLDDGGGFDPDQIPAGHFGIKSMRGRSELVGGRIEIDSHPGGPTRVTFEFPASV